MDKRGDRLSANENHHLSIPLNRTLLSELHLCKCTGFYSQCFALFCSDVGKKKQEDALLHCDSAINTIIPHQSGESSLESRPSCIRDAPEPLM